MRYTKLTKTEEETLQEGYKKHPKGHFRLRCHALLLSNEGMPVKDITRITKTRTRTIYTWMDRWAAKGIMGLSILSGRGIKATLSNKDEALITLVKKKSKNMPVA